MDSLAGMAAWQPHSEAAGWELIATAAEQAQVSAVHCSTVRSAAAEAQRKLSCQSGKNRQLAAVLLRSRQD